MVERAMVERAKVDLIGDWDDLARECDLWDMAGDRPTFWWRDDDAVAASPALVELQRVARGPVALAVIPLAPDRPLEDSLVSAVAAWPAARVLQHGIAHGNVAAAGEKKSEFPPLATPTGPATDVTARLAAGGAALRDAFGTRFVPVLTPPWNRVAMDWLAHLPALGFRGISRFDEPPYKSSLQQKGLREINTQVDVIDWRGSRGFIGESVCLGRLTGHLAARRLEVVEKSQPSGVLTHHLVHDAATWRFLDNLQDWLARRYGEDSFISAADLW